jgi:hypothetical protein
VPTRASPSIETSEMAMNATMPRKNSTIITTAAHSPPHA